MSSGKRFGSPRDEGKGELTREVEAEASQRSLGDGWVTVMNANGAWFYSRLDDFWRRELQTLSASALRRTAECSEGVDGGSMGSEVPTQTKSGSQANPGVDQEHGA